MAATPQATVLKLSSERSEWKICPINYDMKSILDTYDNCYFFVNKEDYLAQDDLQQKLLDHFNVPTFVADRVCTELNGYFGHSTTYNKDSKVEKCSTWFRCLVKMVLKVPDEEKPHEDGIEYIEYHEDGPEKGKPKEEYKWFEMGFFTRWVYPDICQVLCIDTPPDLPGELKEAFTKRPEFRDPFALHNELMNRIIVYYDMSVWRVRDPVRKLEKARLGAGQRFDKMHEISRHAIHTSEALSATIDNMTEMQRCQTEIYLSLTSDLDKTYTEQAKEYMRFQIQMVKGLKLRSESNQKRLKNEIHLAFNNIAHQDNTIMGSIAVLTMVFLPATFFSALFSTTFFTFGNDGWEASNRFWIYWAITIPTTVIVIIIWRLWSWSLVQGYLRSLSWDTLRRSGKIKRGNQVGV